MAGAETVSLIPRVDRREGGETERATTLRAVLAEILPMLQGTRVVGLAEPIGFSTSSIKFQREATQAIESLGADDRLGIVHDTFQHALAGDADIIVRHIRLVHISGIGAVPASSTTRSTRSASLSTKATEPTPRARWRAFSRQATPGPSLMTYVSARSKHRQLQGTDRRVDQLPARSAAPAMTERLAAVNAAPAWAGKCG